MTTLTLNPNGFKTDRIGLWGMQTTIALVATTLIAFLYGSPIMFLVLAAVIVFVASFLRFNPLLYLMVFLLPVPLWVPDGSFPFHNFVTLARIAMFAGIFGRKLLEGESLGKWLWGSRLEKIAMGYCLIAVLSGTVANPIGAPSLRSLSALFSCLALYYSVTGWVNSEPQVWNIMKALFASTLVTCALGFYQFVADGFGAWFYWLHAGQEGQMEHWLGRITSVFFTPNLFALYLNLVLPLAFVVQQRALRPRLALAGKACFFLGTIALILTQSRGAIVAFVFVLVLALRYITTEKRTRKPALLQVILAVAVSLTAITVRAKLQENATPPAAQGEPAARFTELDDSTLYRLTIYSSAWNMFVSSPAMGVGFGNFPFLFSRSEDPDSTLDTHSLYLKLLAETGLLGFISYMFFMLCAIVLARSRLLRESDPLNKICSFALLAGIGTILVHGFVDMTLPLFEFGALLWLILALFRITQRFQHSSP